MPISSRQPYLRFPEKGAAPGLQQITRQIPAAYKSLLYPFSEAWMEYSPTADILHQVLHINGYTVCNHMFMAHENVVLMPESPEAVNVLHFMLKGSIRCNVEGAGALWLRAGQFGCFSINGGVHEAWLEKGQVYESFHIDISPARLTALAPHHQAFRLMESETDTAFVTAGTGIVPQSAYAHIEGIRKMHPGHGMHEVALSARIDLLIAETLPEAQHNGWYGHEGDEALFATIRAYMLHHLAEPLLNSDIASTYCISESKLKTGFRQRFGEAPQGWVRRIRMETASELIRNSTYTLHQIAAMVGYADYSNFSRRFHAHFGHPPSYLKRQ
ncbi:helix-turn-helix transcriptional regulator [Chitinophaga deserti]|uniref:helix-turn-helix transcriptional regulator n=1 Tax=Chitinophaga deserti TaxID=2164099 RepID=UPI000D6AC29F|nr:AraC family transcriptional regulator [Chitinophaga deserti]